MDNDSDKALVTRNALTGEGLMAQARERAAADAQHQIRHGADGAKRVPTWQRLNAYWWLRKGRGSTERALMDGVRRTSSWPTFMRETHARLYTGDRVRDAADVKPEFKFAEKLHELLDDLPEWERLTTRCKGDAYNADSAAAGLVSRMAEHVPEHSKDARESRRQHGILHDDWRELCEQMGEETPPPPELEQLAQRLESAEAEAEGNAEAMDPSAIRHALRAAIKAESKHLDDMDKASLALGWGAQDAGVGEESAAETKAAIAERLAANDSLAEIMEVAGRMRNIMREVQATKVRHGVNEVTDIERGRNLSRLLPSELMMLADPRTKLVLARRLHEAGALQYKLEAEEKVGQGPIVVLIDDSGSMRGSREVWAKGIALALLDLARREERPFAYGTFATQMNHMFVEEPGKKTRPADLLEHLAVHKGGGTNFDVPLAWGLDRVDEHADLEEADLVLISDGQCSASARTLGMVHEADARVWGIAVGPAAMSTATRGSMANFCERVWPVTEIAPGKSNAEEEAAARGVLGL
jgi:uncharacterized protein with von Willebrand factor type A (vWA) domain